MKKYIIEHLKQISAQDLKKFRNEIIITYATTSKLISSGIVELCVNGKGKYVVIDDKKVSYESTNPLDALKNYQKLVNS